MRKFVFIMVIVLLLSAMASGCNQQKEPTPIDILNNNIAFVDQSGNSIYLKDYHSTNFSETPVITKYALVDLNNDGLQEMVAYASQDYDFYIIFYKQKESFYSFEMTEREMVDLKQDGTFMQSESALISKYVQLSFDSDPPITIEKAYKNDIDNIYRIDGSDVTNDEFNNYESSFKKKHSVNWINTQ